MKQKIVDKLKENTAERVFFYMLFVYGVLCAISVMVYAGQYREEWWKTMIAIAGLIFVVRVNYNLLWWFGDHPEE